jgi:hypothetical protein
VKDVSRGLKSRPIGAATGDNGATSERCSTAMVKDGLNTAGGEERTASDWKKRRSVKRDWGADCVGVAKHEACLPGGGR